MADGVTARILGLPELRAELARIEKSTDRATMYTVRQGARVARAAARRRAPVYTGTRADIPRGRLKAAIKSSRRLSNPTKGTYGVTVGPRGVPVTAYAGKQEARTPFMKPAFDEAVPQLTGIAVTAWGRATRRH